MRNKIWITFPLTLMVGFSLLALNISIKKTLNKSNSGLVSATADGDVLKDGDVIFQIQTEGQGKAIQLATKSEYTHTGVLMQHDGQWYVYEAVQPVCKTPLKAFIATGDSGIYVIKRLKKSDSLLNMDKVATMKTYLIAQIGKNYDPYFNWSDSALYCSELVWKCYRKAGISLCTTRQLKSYDLTSTAVKAVMKERYGNKIPMKEKVVSPGDIFNSDLLETVNYTALE